MTKRKFGFLKNIGWWSWFICLGIIAAVIMTVTILSKKENYDVHGNKHRNKECYCVDISGGFGRGACACDGGCTMGLPR